jgi:hypothetical protein
MKHKQFCVALVVMLCVGIAAAQYSQRWACPVTQSLAVLGVENTDADNAKEIVLVSQNLGCIVVIDGQTGVLDTVVSGVTSMNDARLVDTDNDGRYEILFYGWDGGIYYWYLYGYGGVGMNGRPTYAPVGAGTMLGQNSPNPFGDGTQIAYSVASGSRVVLHLYDAAGRVVRTLDDGMRKPGAYTAYWDGRDDKGAKLTPGTYFYELEVNNRRESKKMVLTR